MQIIEINKINIKVGHDPTESRRALARVPERLSVLLLMLGGGSPRYVDGKLIVLCTWPRVITKPTYRTTERSVNPQIGEGP